MPQQYNKGDTITFRDANDGVPLEEQEILTGTVNVTARTKQGISIYWVSVPGKKDEYTVFEQDIVEVVKEKPRFRITPKQEWIPLNEAARVLLAQEQEGKEE